MGTGVLKLPPPLRSKISGFWGEILFFTKSRFDFLQNRRGRGIFYKILKIFRALRAGGFIFFTKSTAKIYLFLNVFWTVSQKPFKIFARRVFGPLKIPNTCFILYKIPQKFSAGGFILYKIPTKKSPVGFT